MRPSGVPSSAVASTATKRNSCSLAMKASTLAALAATSNSDTTTQASCGEAGAAAAAAGAAGVQGSRLRLEISPCEVQGQ